VKKRLLLFVFILLGACESHDRLPGVLPPGNYSAAHKLHLQLPEGHETEFREQALRRAKVWTEPEFPIAQADFSKDPKPTDAFRPAEGIDCKLNVVAVGGTTPKFECILANGETIMVKYTPNNPELNTGVAASRLLNALGFRADPMYLVKEVRCFGCTADPFGALQCLKSGSPDQCLPNLDFTKYIDFKDVEVERWLEGSSVEGEGKEGWAWNELGKIDSLAGGASRAELDAFRLMAAFLAHWDNKAQNQRLVCLAGPKGSCDRSFAMIQDLGATFGPDRMDLKAWRSTPIWSDATGCKVSLKVLPYGGGTFDDVEISEAGRRLLASELSQLSAAQIRTLFETAGFSKVQDWTQVFQEKIQQIVTHPPCPIAP